MTTIIAFSKKLTTPKGAFELPPTQAQLSSNSLENGYRTAGTQSERA